MAQKLKLRQRNPEKVAQNANRYISQAEMQRHFAQEILPYKITSCLMTYNQKLDMQPSQANQALRQALMPKYILVD